MIIIAIVPEKEFAKYNFSRPIYKIISAVKSSLGKQFKKQSFQSLFTIGLMNGYLPCGMVYVALFGALAMNEIHLGILYMVLFGLGTIPLMTAAVYLGKFLNSKVKQRIQKAIPVFVILIGVLFILRGLGLGIPYISPAPMVDMATGTMNCH